MQPKLQKKNTREPEVRGVMSTERQQIVSYVSIKQENKSG